MKPKLKQKLIQSLNRLRNADEDPNSSRFKYRQLTDDPVFVELLSLAREASRKPTTAAEGPRLLHSLSVNDGIDTFIDMLFKLSEPEDETDEETEPTLQ